MSDQAVPPPSSVKDPGRAPDCFNYFPYKRSILAPYVYHCIIISQLFPLHKLYSVHEFYCNHIIVTTLGNMSLGTRHIPYLFISYQDIDLPLDKMNWPKATFYMILFCIVNLIENTHTNILHSHTLAKLKATFPIMNLFSEDSLKVHFCVCIIATCFGRSEEWKVKLYRFHG